MNETAVLHALFAVFVLAGLVAASGVAQIALFGAGGACFLAGIVLARRESGDSDGGRPAES
jgi:hypothetical protein